MEYNDIIGRQYNNLTVVEFLRQEKTGKQQRNRYIYLCKCKCGKDVEVERINLFHDHTKSCGCLKKRFGAANKCWGGAGDLSGRIFSHIRSHAQKRNLSFSISIEDAWQQYLKQNGKCALTGMPISLKNKKGNYSEKSASLDRIDNSSGYKLGNIQWVHKDINWMKGCFVTDRFVELCCLVAAYKGKKNGNNA